MTKSLPLYLSLSMGLAALTASANPTGSNSSNSLTDVNAPDSARMYAEEINRARLLQDAKVIFFNGDEGSRADRDSVQSMLAKFYVDQFRHSQDPEAPLFILMSKDANLAMGIGGTLNVTGWFDWNGVVDGSDFATYLIPIHKTPEDMKNLGASASGSSIFFSIMGRHTPIGDYRAYIEGGFSGYGHKGFKLKKAWFQIRDFTIGLAKSTFSDPAAQPDVLDGAGANGKIDKSNVLVRWMRTWRDRWSLAGSVELPSSQPDENAPMTKKVRDYVPDFAALGQYQWNRGMSHVRLALLLRSMSYRDLVAERNRHVTGWGLQLSSVVRAGRMMTFYALGSYGRGVASYTGDLSNGNYDLLGRPGHTGELYAPATVSVTAGAKVQILPKLSSTVCLSTLRHFPEGGLADETYKYGQYLAVNAVYCVTPRIQAGLEYLAGKRKECNGESGNANRAEAQLIFSF